MTATGYQGDPFHDSPVPPGYTPTARFSPDRRHRYTLFRQTEHALAPFDVSEGPAPKHRRVAFVGLNPSTADETTNDPTVRRCIAFATRWLFEEMVMLNVFALRSTDPRALRTVPREDAIGPENDHWLAVECATADLVVCCWGAHAKLARRGEEVAESLQGINVPLHALGLTKEGHPRHPLYLRWDLKPEPWKGYRYART